MAAQEPLRTEIASIQNSVKEQSGVLKSILSSHNKIISDVRLLLKSLTKVNINNKNFKRLLIGECVGMLMMYD